MGSFFAKRVGGSARRCTQAKLLLSWVLLGVLAACSNGGSKPDDGVKQDIPANNQFITWESASVRPMVQSIDGQRLYVTNTPDNRVEVFAQTESGQLEFQNSIAVGMEPVALALHDDKLWVVNHLSDSISVVDLSASIPRVERTLLVGDEPRDIVITKDRAFITTAHRGQHRTHASIASVPGAGDPQLHEPSVGRADVWVFDTNNLGTSLGGTPEKIIELFGDTARALTVSPDGETVYAAVFNSGNQTSVVHEAVACYGFTDDELGSQPCQVKDGITMPNGLDGATLPGGRLAPGKNAEGIDQPWTAMIVKYDRESGEWRDPADRNFSNGIRFSLPDYDVFAINATSLEESARYAHVGTTLFNMAVNPVNGNVYVSNTEANNAVRFEGPGEHGGSTVQGNIARSQISVISVTQNSVSPRHLNRHIDYSQLKAASGVKDHSVAIPTQMEVSADGSTLYVAALGSNKVAVYDTAQLENAGLWDGEGDEFDPTAASAFHIDVEGGPSGLLLDNSNAETVKLYVLNRFDNSVAVIDTNTGNELQRLTMFNPEPEAVIAGRPMLYDAHRSSSNGEAACASCHVFGDLDQLAWNLGNPDASNATNPQPFPTIGFSHLSCFFTEQGFDSPDCQFSAFINGNGDLQTFASMKGPMTTQTLRGMSTHGHLHWRGDRSNGYFEVDNAQTLDEKTSFKNFIVAFEGLLGLDIALPENSDVDTKTNDVVALEADVDRFADFAMQIQLPPNPLRGLDKSFSASAQLGENFFAGIRRSDGLDTDYNDNGPEADGATCEGCHGHDPEQGFYGTRGEVAHGGEILILKVPHFRNLYQKVGMFGLPDREGFLPSDTREDQGDQIRGFGFLHDGATDTLLNFLRGGVFDDGEKGCENGTDASHGCEFNEGFVGIPSEEVRQGLVDFVLEFDSDFAPIVGQQVTISPGASTAFKQRWSLLEARAGTEHKAKILGGTTVECDLIAQGIVEGELRGYFYTPSNDSYRSDKAEEDALSREALQTIIDDQGTPLTFSCVPPGSGYRVALDRDLDGYMNRDEIDLGSDPMDGNSIPST